MSDGIKGSSTYQCSKCGAKHFLRDEDFHFEAESGSERGMGQETQYVSEIDHECSKCDNDIYLKFEVWEYPVGIINMTDEDATGAEILDSSFEIYHEPPPPDEVEESVKLVKSLVSFRFDTFAELFVDFWVRAYKKSPRPTAIISAVGLVIGVRGIGSTIYFSEIDRKQRLQQPQSFNEQIELLQATERNLNDLSSFIANKNNEIETTRSLIKGLEEKKSQLEPIVNAHQETVDAIFEQQRREFEKDIWLERAISFGFGILASLIATVIWHFVGRVKSGRRA